MPVQDDASGESTTLTLRLTAELKDRLGLLAEQTQRSRSFLANEAVASYVDRELAIIAGIHKGMEDIASGRFVTQEEAMRRFRKTIAKTAKRRT